ncbi:unnamed protein product [Amoebophrya sp. A25]|nr:unnamed protein product [Amoebophrya sp. A25]|eukprot:GSA25T00020511001.1
MKMVSSTKDNGNMVIAGQRSNCVSSASGQRSDCGFTSAKVERSKEHGKKTDNHNSKIADHDHCSRDGHPLCFGCVPIPLACFLHALVFSSSSAYPGIRTPGCSCLTLSLPHVEV